MFTIGGVMSARTSLDLVTFEFHLMYFFSLSRRMVAAVASVEMYYFGYVRDKMREKE